MEQGHGNREGEEETERQKRGGAAEKSEAEGSEGRKSEEEGREGPERSPEAAEGEGLVVPRLPRLPAEPSAREVAEHEATGHAVYRSWCRHCVAAKGRSHAHTSKEEGELPEVGVDYGFFGRGAEDTMPSLCVRDRQTGSLAATVIDNKGNTTTPRHFSSPPSLVWVTNVYCYVRITNRRFLDCSRVLLRTCRAWSSCR